MTFIIFLLFFLLISALSYYLIGRLGALITPLPMWGKVLYWSLGWGLILSWPITMAFESHLPFWFNRWLYLIGSGWIILLIYLLLLSFLFDLLWLSERWFHWMPSAVRSILQPNRNPLLFTLIVGGLLLLVLLGNLQYHRKAVVEVEIPVDDLSLNGVVIVAASDLHLGYTITAKEFGNWVEQIKGEEADYLLIVGDLIDSSIRPIEAEISSYQALFTDLDMPIYAVLGNHEYIGDRERNRQFFEAMGIRLLIDETVEIAPKLHLIGRDDWSNKERQPLSSLMREEMEDHFTIVMDHQPHHLHESVAEKVNLHLSGHTHQGQIWPYSWITKWLYELDYGVKMVENTRLIISSGLGIWGGKFRIGTQSEYIKITLRYQPS